MNNIALFNLNVTLTLKNYVTHKTASPIKDNYIAGESIEEVIGKLWDLIKPMISKKVRYMNIEDSNELTVIVDTNLPEFEDMNSYLVVFDASGKKKLNSMKLHPCF
jgi:hypothetical protein